MARAPKAKSAAKADGGYTYLGPAATLIVDGTAYHPGDSVPLSEDQVRILAKNGSHHQFEGYEPDEDVEPSEDRPVIENDTADADNP